MSSSASSPVTASSEPNPQGFNSNPDHVKCKVCKEPYRVLTSASQATSPASQPKLSTSSSASQPQATINPNHQSSGSPVSNDVSAPDQQILILNGDDTVMNAPMKRGLVSPDGTSSPSPVLSDALSLSPMGTVNNTSLTTGHKEHHTSMSGLNNRGDSLKLVNECWICYDSERTDAGPLIHPCSCKGDVSAVHHECLKQWLMESCSNPEHVKCKVCKEQYRVQSGEFWLPSGLTISHWVQTAFIIFIMCSAAIGVCIIVKLFEHLYVRTISVGAAILVEYICLRFLGFNMINAYHRAKFSAIKILGRRLAHDNNQQQIQQQLQHHHSSSSTFSPQNNPHNGNQQYQRKSVSSNHQSINIEVVGDSPVVCSVDTPLESTISTRNNQQDATHHDNRDTISTHNQHQQSSSSSSYGFSSSTGVV